MYKNWFEKILGVVGITSIGLIDGVLIGVAAMLIHYSVYSVVGYLYDLDIISGKIAGKICYFIIWLASLVGCVFLALYCQKNTIALIVVIAVLVVYNIIYKIVKHKCRA